MNLVACRIAMLGVLLAATLGGARAAQAQIDTPAAREARAALSAVEKTYGERNEWAGWALLLRLPDVKYELRAGDHAQPEALRHAIVELLGGRVPQFVEPPFARLAKALDVRAQELVTIPASEWPSACGDRAQRYLSVSVAEVELAREEFAARLDEFEQYFPAVRQADDAWSKFLYWPETRALATPAKPAPGPDAALLDRLDTRWAAAPAVWDDDLLFETSVAARSYIRKLRGYLQGETREQYAAAWNALADLLVPGPGEHADTSKIAAAVYQRESLDQASRLTASIRRELSRPNLVVEARSDWLAAQFAEKIDEPFEVNGVFAGTRSVGSGRMVGDLTAEILPSTAVGQWLLRIRGTSTSRASGGQDRVSVVSRATTRFSASKPFVLDASGLNSGRASAGAVTSITYESINAQGLPRRRSAAISETYARRPQAEAESAAYARRSLLEQINTQADKMAADFNRSFYERLRDPRINSNRPFPEVRVRSGDGASRWECWLAGPAAFGAPEAAPQFDAGTDVVVSLAASALEEQGVMALGGRTMTAQELLEAMGPAFGEAGESNAEEFTVSFEADPCDVRFHEGAIHARLYVTQFDSADVQYPAMAVDVVYQPEERDGRVVFVRQGRVRVTSRPTADGKKPAVSGRQQTLRLAVERRLARVLASELVWSEMKLPLAEEADDATSLELKRVRLDAPWLQFGLSPAPKS